MRDLSFGGTRPSIHSAVAPQRRHLAIFAPKERDYERSERHSAEYQTDEYESAHYLTSPLRAER